ncbi:MAG TPA: DUF3301 domain-containing protein [Burkholderiales bacterium]
MIVESLLDWCPLLLAAGGGWFWYDSMRARERAVRLGRETCRRRGLLFLDDTVALDSIAFARSGGGRLILRRTYRFEFSDTGDNRLKGSVTLSGEKLELISLEPHGAYEGGSTLLS